MEKRNLTCIGCPMGCQLQVEYEPGNRESVKVTGNTCNIGAKYGVDEVINPTRTITGTIRVLNRKQTVVSVKTVPQIPKADIDKVAKKLCEISVEAPVHIGDVVFKNICETGADIIITKNVD